MSSRRSHAAQNAPGRSAVSGYLRAWGGGVVELQAAVRRDAAGGARAVAHLLRLPRPALGLVLAGVLPAAAVPVVLLLSACGAFRDHPSFAAIAGRPTVVCAVAIACGGLGVLALERPRSWSPRAYARQLLSRVQTLRAASGADSTSRTRKEGAVT